MMPVLLLLALLGVGCAPHSVADRPEPEVPGPDAWSLALAEAAGDADAAWWDGLGDPALGELIEEALRGNLGAAAALARVAQADALARQARSLYRPQLDAFAEGEVSWDREDRGQDEAALGAALAWELDLFGRLRSTERAFDAERAATVADHAATRLLLSARVADAWYGAMEQQLQHALLHEQRELATTLVELTELRFAQGDASAVDVLQQRSVLEEVEGEVPAAHARLRSFENGLDVLLGRAPDGLARSRPELASLPAPESVPPVGVPADLLVRRPDLASRGRVVVAADHRIAEAIADRAAARRPDRQRRPRRSRARRLGSRVRAVRQPRAAAHGKKSFRPSSVVLKELLVRASR